MAPHDWNAADYDRVNAGIIALGVEVLERLPLHGDETVLDAGCGTGALTRRLVERLPDGAAIALDASPQMVEYARERLGDSAEVLQADLAHFDLGGRTVDAVFSTATFHWLKDHEQLFRNLRGVTRDGGRLVAQCGGLGNIEPINSVLHEVSRREPYASALPWDQPHHFAGPEETQRRLAAAGYATSKCWLEDRPIYPEDVGKHLREVVLGAHIEALGPQTGEQFAREVEAELGDYDSVAYVRLNIDAVA
ncbi:MAG: class I SAM-dependent methyltransferase [Solirubrobacterales bacterium]